VVLPSITSAKPSVTDVQPVTSDIDRTRPAPRPHFSESTHTGDQMTFAPRNPLSEVTRTRIRAATIQDSAIAEARGLQTRATSMRLIVPSGATRLSDQRIAAIADANGAVARPQRYQRYILCDRRPASTVPSGAEGKLVLGPGQSYEDAAGRPHLVANAGESSMTILVLQGVGEYDYVPLV
jgi:hypothetical protein